MDGKRCRAPLRRFTREARRFMVSSRDHREKEYNVAHLITGGTGFLGVDLTKRLVERGEEVVIFDARPNMRALSGIADKVTVLRGDVSDLSEILDAVQDRSIQSIFHLGALLSIPADENPHAAYRVNANGTMHVLEAARMFGVQKVIYPSTMAIYAGNTGRIDESTGQAPDGIYAVTKLFSELLGRFYHRKYGIDFRCVRFSTVVGLGAMTKHMTQYMAWMIERSLEGKPFEVWVAEETRNPFLYYKDAVGALLKLHDAPAKEIVTRVYNLAGTSATAGEFADIVRDQIEGAKISFNPDPDAMRLFGKGTGTVDDSAARNEWGWRAEYGTQETILDMKRTFEAAQGS
jgi:threonine 3-dehydrogenase